MNVLISAANPRRALVVRLLLLSLCLVRLAAPALAQTPPAGVTQPPPSTPPADDPIGRSTPYGTVMGFLQAGGSGDYERARQYLQTGGGRAAGQELARQLFEVMDLALTADLDRLRRVPGSIPQQGSTPVRERVGTITTDSQTVEILLEQVERRGQGPIWLFASTSLEAVPALASELDPLDLGKYLPRFLVEIRVFSVPLHRWIGMALLLGLALSLGSIVARALLVVLRAASRRVSGEEDAHTVASIATPIRLVLTAIAIRLFSTLGASLQLRQFWTRVAAALAIVGLAWLLIRVANVVAALIARNLRRRQSLGKLAMVTLLRRLFTAGVVVVAALLLLYRANVDLTPVLTGLGIGGLGLALAAQKTLENLLGGIMIITDEPVRVGDFCKVGDQTGTVEDVGIRSTKIRTLARTLLAVPNGQLAAMTIENLAVKDRFLFSHTIRVKLATSPDQLRDLLAGIRSVLYAHSKVHPEGARVRFVGFGAYSLDLEIFAYVHTTELPDFLAIQEDLLLHIMDLVAGSGTSVAFPSQTTYITRDTPIDSQKARDAEARVREWRDQGALPFPDFPPERRGQLAGSVQYPPPGSAIPDKTRHGTGV